MRITSPKSNSWQHRPERSSFAVLRTMAWLSLKLGRRCSRWLLYPITLYFALFAPAASAASRDYLRRVLNRPPRWRDRYQHFFTFATTIHDRVYLLNQRYDLFQIETFGLDDMQAALADGAGVFLLGAHLGSFEVLRALGYQRPELQVAMAMFEGNARNMQRLIESLNPAAQQDVIALGHIDSMLNVKARLEAGAMVGILADRTFGDDTLMPVTLFNATAQLPLGPFRMAAILRRPVLFMTALHVGANRYEIHFEKLADFSDLAAGTRQTALTQALQNYAGLLEKYCRHAPFNWFNFFDFWRAAPLSSKHKETQ